MDRQLFIQYVKANQERLRRYLAGLCCGDLQLADDIAQDTYMKAYLAVDTFREESRFTSWVYSIAYNTFISYRRTLRPSADLDEARHLPADSRDDYRELYAALAQLGERERSAVLLYYIQGYSVREIAHIMQTSEGAVKQLMSRGRKHLREKLQAYD